MAKGDREYRWRGEVATSPRKSRVMPTRNCTTPPGTRPRRRPLPPRPEPAAALCLAHLGYLARALRETLPVSQLSISVLRALHLSFRRRPLSISVPCPTPQHPDALSPSSYTIPRRYPGHRIGVREDFASPSRPTLGNRSSSSGPSLALLSPAEG